MNEELTREVLEEMVNCDGKCIGCPAQSVCDTVGIKRSLATALLEERAKLKVWNEAPDDATQAQIKWFTKYGGFSGIKVYTRELPKTRTRIMAEEIASAHISNKSDLVDIIEQTITAHMKELEGKE